MKEHKMDKDDIKALRHEVLFFHNFNLIFEDFIFDFGKCHEPFTAYSWSFY